MQKQLVFKNTKIHFSDQGKGAAVVLLHGFLENSTMWNPLLPALLKNNRVITIDLLGHAKTACIGYVHTMELFAETVTAVLKHLRIRKTIVIGHSLGGYVALAFAEKNPKKIKGLCLLNATSSEDSLERKALRTRANQMISEHFTNMVRMSFTNLFDSTSRETHKVAIHKALEEALQTSKQGYVAAQEGMKLRINRNHVLTDYHFKKLFIVGKHDPVVNVKRAFKEAQKTNSDIVVLPGGHMPHIENIKELQAALTTFIKKAKAYTSPVAYI